MWKDHERQQRESFRQKAPAPSAFRRDSLDGEEYRRCAMLGGCWEAAAKAVVG